MLEIGTKAPEFLLCGIQNGEFRSLSDYKGQKVNLYFYPGHDRGLHRPGVQNFLDLYPPAEGEGRQVVLGMSK